MKDPAGATTAATTTVEVLGPPTEGAGIDRLWLGSVVGAAAAFAAGVALGVFVLDRPRNRQRPDEPFKP